VLVGAVVAGCVLLDKRGIEHASPLTYVLLVTAGPCTLYPLWIARRKGLPAIRAEARLPAVAAGAALFVSYALLLAALDRAPAAAVAAVRETGVVLVAVSAWLVLKERVGPGRLGGAVLVAGGIALLSG
jgi:drug/metabolite transporter (DMT)-like permease